MAENTNENEQVITTKNTETKVSKGFNTTNGVVGSAENGAKSHVDIAGDSGLRVDDGTKEGGVITNDLVEGKKAADQLNKELGTPGY